jgi:hypothetical protein
MIDGREIIEASAPTRRTSSFVDPTVSTEREIRAAARSALRFLENCPEESTVSELRSAIQDAFPGVLSGGGAG